MLQRRYTFAETFDLAPKQWGSIVYLHTVIGCDGAVIGEDVEVFVCQSCVMVEDETVHVS